LSGLSTKKKKKKRKKGKEGKEKENGVYDSISTLWLDTKMLLTSHT
jgi:hypothetical protein